jgi:glucosylceramidase
MEDEKFRKAISGASYQWAGKFGITQAYEDYPELDTINGEMECCDGQNSWQQALYANEMMHHYFRYGSRACVYWNMALVKDSISTWGWKQNSLISVGDGEYEYTNDFYAIKHFAHFVKKGAVLLSTKGRASSCATVFRNPDGTRAAVIVNPYDFEKVLTIEDKNYVLPPRSFNTMVI